MTLPKKNMLHNKGIHICDLIRLLLIALALLILVGGRDLDSAVVIPSLVFLVVIFLFSSEKLSIKQPLIPLFSISLVFYYCLRLTNYFVTEPDNLLSFFSIDQTLNSGAGVYAMAFAAAATFSAYFGLWLSSVNGKQHCDNLMSVKRSPDPFAVLLVFCVAYLLNVLIQAEGGETVRHMNPAIKGLAVLLNLEVWLYVAIYYCATYFPGSKRDRVLFFLLFIYVVTRGVNGSRSGVVEFLMVWFSYYAAFFGGNIRVRLSPRTIVLVVSASIGSVWLYFWVAALRAAQYQMDVSVEFENALDIFSADAYQQFIFQTIIYRVGVNLDNLFFVLSDKYDVIHANSLVNIQTAFLSTIERLIHIDLDPDVIPAEYALARLLGTDTFFMVGQHEQSVAYSWGMLSYFYQLFGPIMSLVLLFVLFFLVGRLFITFSSCPSRFLRTTIAVLAAYVLQCIVMMFGFDNLIDRLHRMAICFVFVMLVIKLLPRSRTPVVCIK